MLINEMYQEAITLPSPRTAFRMTDLETNEVITSVGDGLLIESPWDFVSDGFIGEFPVWKLKAMFMYLGDKKSYIDHEFYCETGAYSQDNDGMYSDIQWIPIGYFTVPKDGQTTDEIMMQISLTLYDRGSLLDKRYEPLSFPLTGLEVRSEITSLCGVEFATGQTTLRFDNFIFQSINVSSEQAITYREVLRQYAQLNMANVFVNRYGKLEIKSVFGALPIDAEVSNFDYDVFKNELPYGPINSLIYSNKPEGDDQSYQDIESKDDGSIALNGKLSLGFSNNIFIDPLSLEQQQMIVNELFTFVNGFSYTPFELNYFARPDFDPYDLLPVKDMTGNVGIVPLTSLSFNYNGGLIGVLKTKRLPGTLPKSEIPDIFERINNAEIRVDRVNNRITLEVTELKNYTDSKVGNVTVGGRNFILKSSVPKASSVYEIARYDMSVDWELDTEYTITIKGTITERQSYGIWANGSSTKVAHITPNPSGITQATFKTGDAINSAFPKTLRVYNVPNIPGVEASIEWIKLEKGNKGTDWTPAPEDLMNEIGRVETESKASIEANNERIQLEKSSREIQYGTLNDVLNSQSSKLTLLDGRVTTEIESVKQEIDGTLEESKNYTDQRVDGFTQTYTQRLENAEGQLEEIESVFSYDAPTATLSLGLSTNPVGMNLKPNEVEFIHKQSGIRSAFSFDGMYNKQWSNDVHVIKAFEENDIKGTIWLDKGSGE